MLGDDELEVFDGFANKAGFWSVGGRLVLTDRRLIFTNRRKSAVRVQFPLTDISHVGRARSLLTTNNQIRVTLLGGKSQKFTVYKAARWVELIDEWRRKAQGLTA